MNVQSNYMELFYLLGYLDIANLGIALRESRVQIGRNHEMGREKIQQH